MRALTIRKFALTATLVSLLPVALLNARLDLERAWNKSRQLRLEEISFPSETTIRLLSLNYNTLAADVMWFVLTVQHGQYIYYRSAAAENVLENATTLARTDPYFYQVYHWGPGAYLNRRWPITDEDLRDVAALIDVGIEAHPSDADLRSSAALLFVGYGKFGPETMVEQSERAIEYLDAAIELAPDDVQLVAVRQFFRHRITKYGGAAPSDDTKLDADFWFKLYTSATDPRVQRNAADQLKQLGKFDSMIRKNIGTVFERYRADRPFIPFEMWLLLQGPQEGI